MSGAASNGFSTWQRSLAGLVFVSLALGACSCAGEKKKDQLREAPPEPAHIALDEEELRFDALGDERQLLAAVRDNLGRPMDRVTVTWTSSDPRIAAVDASGRVLSAGNGAAAITAAAGKVKATAQVFVQQQAVSLQIHPSELHFEELEAEAPLYLTAFDRNDHALPHAPADWRSEDVAVAQVDKEGVVRATGLGQTQVIAKLLGSELSAEAKVTVAPKPARLQVQLFTQPFVAGRPGEARVSLLDERGERLVAPSFEITIGLGENPHGATLGGTQSESTRDGVAVFSDLRIDRAGAGYTLRAKLGELVAESDPFEVVPGPPARLAFVQQPADGIAGVTLPRVSVAVLDAAGNPLPDAAEEVHLRLQEPVGTGELYGELVVWSSGGLAHFDDLRVRRAAADHRLVAAHPFWKEEAISEPFAIAAAAADALRWVEQPADAASGENIGPVSVEVIDRFSNRVLGFEGTVELALLEGPEEAVLEGDATADFAAGLASFETLSIDRVGTYRLSATSGGMGAFESEPFTIAAGAPQALRFLRSPLGGNQGELLDATEVEVVDAAGNRAPIAVPVELSLIGGPGTLSGSASLETAAGVARFSDLRIDEAGTGYRLVAESGDLEPATSPPFDVSTCPSGLFACGEACVDFDDPATCGGCETSCEEGQSCVNRVCEWPACPGEEMRCGGECVDTSSDPLRCGDCDTVCEEGEVCQAGSCVTPSCPAGQVFCGDVCTDIQNDPRFCGGCQTACQEHDLCQDGVCMPDPEYANWPVPPEALTAAHYDVTTTPGTVIDLTTKLMWERSPPTQRMSWAAAEARCESLTEAGFDDWRLPSMMELSSILNVSGKFLWWNDDATTAAIVTQAFNNTQYSSRHASFRYAYWSRSPVCGGTPCDPTESKAWSVDFGLGGLFHTQKNQEGWVRCVRYGPGYPTRAQMPTVRLSVHGPQGGPNRYVEDHHTGLKWQDGGFGYMKYSPARNQCGTKSYDGRTARLPSMRELTTVFDIRRWDPAFDDTAFSPVIPWDGLTVGRLWTSTTGGQYYDGYYGYIYFHYLLTFDPGNNVGVSKMDAETVQGFRCVASP